MRCSQIVVFVWVLGYTEQVIGDGCGDLFLIYFLHQFPFVIEDGQIEVTVNRCFRGKKNIVVTR